MFGIPVLFLISDLLMLLVVGAAVVVVAIAVLSVTPALVPACLEVAVILASVLLLLFVSVSSMALAVLLTTSLLDVVVLSPNEGGLSFGMSWSLSFSESFLFWPFLNEFLLGDFGIKTATPSLIAVRRGGRLDPLLLCKESRSSSPSFRFCAGPGANISSFRRRLGLVPLAGVLPRSPLVVRFGVVVWPVGLDPCCCRISSSGDLEELLLPALLESLREPASLVRCWSRRRIGDRDDTFRVRGFVTTGDDDVRFCPRGRRSGDSKPFLVPLLLLPRDATTGDGERRVSLRLMGDRLFLVVEFFDDSFSFPAGDGDLCRCERPRPRDITGDGRLMDISPCGTIGGRCSLELRSWFLLLLVFRSRMGDALNLISTRVSFRRRWGDAEASLLLPEPVLSLLRPPPLARDDSIWVVGCLPPMSFLFSLLLLFLATAVFVLMIVLSLIVVVFDCGLGGRLDGSLPADVFPSVRCSMELVVQFLVSQVVRSSL